MPYIILCLIFSLSAIKALAAHEPQTHDHKTKTQQHYLKPGASIRMHGPENTATKLGEIKTLSFNFLSAEKTGTAHISVNADPRLQMSGGSNYTFELSEPSQGEPSQGEISLDIEINPNAEGRFYLQFFVELNGKTRAFSYPINVGETQLEEQALSVQEKTSSDNKKVKIMQAQERVRLHE